MALARWGPGWGRCLSLSVGADAIASIPRTAVRKQQDMTPSFFIPQSLRQLCSDVMTITRSFLASTHNPLHHIKYFQTSQKWLAFTSNEMLEDLPIVPGTGDQ